MAQAPAHEAQAQEQVQAGRYAQGGIARQAADEWDEDVLRSSYCNLDRRRGGGIKVIMEITSSDDEVVEVEHELQAEAEAKVKKEASPDDEVVEAEHEVQVGAKAKVKKDVTAVMKAEVNAEVQAGVKAEVKQEVNAAVPRGKKRHAQLGFFFQQEKRRRLLSEVDEEIQIVEDAMTAREKVARKEAEYAELCM